LDGSANARAITGNPSFEPPKSGNKRGGWLPNRPQKLIYGGDKLGIRFKNFNEAALFVLVIEQDDGNRPKGASAASANAGFSLQILNEAVC
jgi:hypothetical protein